MKHGWLEFETPLSFGMPMVLGAMPALVIQTTLCFTTAFVSTPVKSQTIFYKVVAAMVSSPAAEAELSYRSISRTSYLLSSYRDIPSHNDQHLGCGVSSVSRHAYQGSPWPRSCSLGPAGSVLGLSRGSIQPSPSLPPTSPPSHTTPRLPLLHSYTHPFT